MSIKIDNILADMSKCTNFLPAEQKHKNPLENRVTIKIVKAEPNRDYSKSKNENEL